jgi:hypothetical protein
LRAIERSKYNNVTAFDTRFLHIDNLPGKCSKVLRFLPDHVSSPTGRAGAELIDSPPREYAWIQSGVSEELRATK